MSNKTEEAFDDTNPLIEWWTAADGEKTISVGDTLGWVRQIMWFIDNNLQPRFEGKHDSPDHLHVGNGHYALTLCMAHALKAVEHYTSEDECRMKAIVKERDSLQVELMRVSGGDAA